MKYIKMKHIGMKPMNRQLLIRAIAKALFLGFATAVLVAATAM